MPVLLFHNYNENKSAVNYVGTFLITCPTLALYNSILDSWQI